MRSTEMMLYNRTMDIRIKTTDYQITPEVSAYLDEHIAAIGKHVAADIEDATRVEAEVGRIAGHKHGEVWFAEINLIQPGMQLMNARAEGESVNESIEKVKNEIMAQLKKSKDERLTDIKKGGMEAKELLRAEDQG